MTGTTIVARARGEGWGLLALQGPEAAKYLQTLMSFHLRSLTFAPLGGFNLRVARGGYTGEDGFEVYPSLSDSPVSQCQHSTPTDLGASHRNYRSRRTPQAPIKLTGLPARGSLRLKAGMCPHCQELGEDTSPIEAGLSWVIGRERRETGGFIGADLVLKHLKDGSPRRRVGFIVDGAPARGRFPLSLCFMWIPRWVDCRGRQNPQTLIWRPRRNCHIRDPISKNITMGYVENR